MNFSVDREPIDLVLGGEHFATPPVLGGSQLGGLLDKHAAMTEAFGRLEKAATGGTADGKAMAEVLELVASIFDEIFGKDDEGRLSEQATRFRKRLFSHSDPFDLQREVVPAVIALVEEYSGGRPTVPSSPSTTPPRGDGTDSTGGPQQKGLTPLGLALTGSAT